MPKETHLEFKVGAFVLLGLLALTVFLFSISDSSVLEQGKNFKIVYNFAGGLKKNAPVRVAGVDEGIVTGITLFFDKADSRTKAEVEVKVSRNTRIPVDSKYKINQLGILGEKYVEIVPGEDIKDFVKNGDVVVGKDPVLQEDISEKVMEVAGKLDLTIGGVNKIITDEANIESLSNTFAHMDELSGGLKDIINDIKAGKGNVGKLFYDAQLYDNLQAMTSDLKDNPWKLLYRPKEKR